MTNPQPIKIAIAENDRLVREGMKYLLAGHDDLALVGQTDMGDDLFPLLDKTQPDVLIISDHLPRNHQPPIEPFGLVAAVRQMAETHPETAVILVAEYHIPLVGHALAVEQVRGFILREDRLALELPAAVRTVHDGGAFLSETASQELFRLPEWEEVGRLDEGHMAVLSALTAMPEATRMEHAHRAGMTDSVFYAHLQQLYERLGAWDRLSAVLRALKVGVLRIEDL